MNQYIIPGISGSMEALPEDSGVTIIWTPVKDKEIVNVLVTFPSGDDPDLFSAAIVLEGNSTHQLTYNPSGDPSRFQIKQSEFEVTFKDGVGTLVAKEFICQLNSGNPFLGNNTTLGSWDVH